MKDNTVDLEQKRKEVEEQKKNDDRVPKMSILESALSGISGSVPGAEESEGLDWLGAVLTLPDREFSLMKDFIIAELEKGLNNTNDRLLLVQSLNAAGLRTEDLIELYSVLIKQIEDSFKGKVSQQKIDFVKQVLCMIVNTISETEGIPKRIIQIPIELCNEEAKMPTYANVGDAGLDVYAMDDYEILPGETMLIPLGFKVAIPLGYELQVRPKSGRALKTKLRIANTPGTIDSGYRDEVAVIVENIEPKIVDIGYEFNENNKPVITSILHGKPYTIGKGEKFAQLILSEVPTAKLYQVESVAKIGENRGGGFGSSGLR